MKQASYVVNPEQTAAGSPVSFLRWFHAQVIGPMAWNAQKGGRSADRGNDADGGVGAGGGWSQEMAWAPGGWDEADMGSGVQGAGQALVHETHAPKRISHIQFGLLNSEVRAEMLPLTVCTRTLYVCLCSRESRVARVSAIP